MSGDKKNRPVLLVDDNPVDVDLTLRAFAKSRIVNPISVVKNGEEALVWLEERMTEEPMPLLILLDLKLPGIQGFDVLLQMKSQPVSRSIPVVVLSASDDDADVENAYRLGANSYIVKPIDFSNFIEVAARIELYWCALNRPPK
jgi:hypothetical protein